jgi:hypothetical protein
MRRCSSPGLLSLNSAICVPVWLTDTVEMSYRVCQVIFDRQSTRRLVHTNRYCARNVIVHTNRYCARNVIVHTNRYCARNVIVHTRRVLCTSLQVRAHRAGYRATTLDQSCSDYGRGILNSVVSVLELAFWFYSALQLQRQTFKECRYECLG